MSDATSLVKLPDVPASANPAEKFELIQRQARLFAASPLVPSHIADGGSPRGVANCYVALVIAEQMNENPLVVMQNIYIVNGRPGWSASYMIAKANASGVFRGVIRFKHSGSGPTRECVASAILRDSGEVVESKVTMEMAQAEGWTKNPKYKTMPDQMLIYRAATFLIRTYCPQVLLGFRTVDEVEDIAHAEKQPRLTMAALVDQESDNPAPTSVQSDLFPAKAANLPD